jgi:S1-C subfamily serine protease
MEPAPESHYYRFKFLDRYEFAMVAVCANDTNGDPTPLGTGFFVADQGYLVTAAHLISDLDSYTDLFVLQRAEGNHLDVRRFDALTTNTDTDLAVLRLLPTDCSLCAAHPILSIMNLPPDVGEISGAFGYPGTRIRTDGNEDEVETTLNATFSVGRILDRHDRGPYISGPCYSSNFVIDHGGSGGPVFNSNGFVTAVYSRGAEDIDQGPHSWVVAVSDVFAMNIPDESRNDVNVGELVRHSAGWYHRPPNVKYSRYQP